MKLESNRDRSQLICQQGQAMTGIKVGILLLISLPYHRITVLLSTLILVKYLMLGGALGEATRIAHFARD